MSLTLGLSFQARTQIKNGMNKVPGKIYGHKGKKMITKKII